VLAPVVGSRDTDRRLPFKTYLPYSISDFFSYIATYLQHVGAIFYGVLLNVAFDSLVYGFTVHVCGQIELLRHRLSEIFRDYSDTGRRCRIIPGHEDAIIGQCVKHHLCICVRDRASNTIVDRVDRDDFICFQHDHLVHQHFPNVQGSVTSEFCD